MLTVVMEGVEFPKLNVREIIALGEVAHDRAIRNLKDALDYAGCSSQERAESFIELTRARGTSPSIVRYVMSYEGSMDAVERSLVRCANPDAGRELLEGMDANAITRLAFELIGFQLTEPEHRERAGHEDDEEIAPEGLGDDPTEGGVTGWGTPPSSPPSSPDSVIPSV